MASPTLSSRLDSEGSGPLPPVVKQRFQTLGLIGHQAADPHAKKPDHFIRVVHGPHMDRPTEPVAEIKKALVDQADPILPDGDLGHTGGGVVV